jgi:hypothetical protein
MHLENRSEEHVKDCYTLILFLVFHHINLLLLLFLLHLLLLFIHLLGPVF